MILLKKIDKSILVVLLSMCVGCSNTNSSNDVVSNELSLNPIEEVQYSNDGKIISIDKFEYNNNNQLIKKTSENDEITYVYEDDVVVKSIRSTGYSNYTYDDMKQLTRIDTYNLDNELIETRTHEYDDNGNVVRSAYEVIGEEPIVSLYTFDKTGKLVTVMVDNYKTTYEYDSSEKCIQETSYLNGIVDSNIISTYKDELLNTQITFKSDGSELIRLQYVYDENNRLIEILSSTDNGNNFYKSTEYKY